MNPGGGGGGGGDATDLRRRAMSRRATLTKDLGSSMGKTSPETGSIRRLATVAMSPSGTDGISGSRSVLGGGGASSTGTRLFRAMSFSSRSPPAPENSAGIDHLERGSLSPVSTTAKDETLRTLEKRCSDLEAERDSYKFRIEQVESDLNSEIRDLRDMVEDFRNQQEDMQARLAQVQLVEKSLRGLYKELSQRCTDLGVRLAAPPEVSTNIRGPGGGGSRAPIHTNNIIDSDDDCKNVSSLIMVEYVRALARTLITNLEDTQDLFRKQLDIRAENVHNIKANLEYQVESLDHDNSELRKSIERLMKEKSEAIADLEAKIAKRDETIEERDGEMERVQGELEEAQSIIADMRDSVVEKNKNLQSKDMELMRVSQLENAMVRDRAKFQDALNRFRAQSSKSQQQYMRDIRFFTKIHSEKEKLEDQLKKAQQEIQSLRFDHSRVKVDDATVKAKRLESALASRDEQMRQMESENSRLGIELGKMQTKFENCKTKYTDLMKMIQEQKPFSGAGKDSEMSSRRPFSAEFSRDVQNNPFLIDVYKKKLDEKEKEIDSLHKRIRRLLLIENRSKILEQAFERERVRLESELDTARKKMDAMARSAALSNATHSAHGPTGVSSQHFSRRYIDDIVRRNDTLEEEMRDYENMAAITEGAVHALNRMMKSVSTSGSPSTTSMVGVDVDGGRRSDSRTSLPAVGGSNSSISSIPNSTTNRPRSASQQKSSSGIGPSKSLSSPSQSSFRGANHDPATASTQRPKTSTGVR